jgi:myo-inositol-1-phosphate synthase
MNAKAKGKLLVLLPGMGAVATTFVAGVELVRRGLGRPIGSLTQLQTIRLGKRSENRSPLIRDLVDLASLEDLEFAGWDIYPESAYEAASKAQVLRPDHLEPTKDFLRSIQPMPAAFDQNYVRRLSGTHVKAHKTLREQAEALREDIRMSLKKSGATRAVMVWCGSTEIYLRPAACHLSIEAFEKGLNENCTPMQRSWRASPMPTVRPTCPRTRPH